MQRNVYQQTLCSTSAHSYISYSSGLLSWKTGTEWQTVIQIHPWSSLKPKGKGLFGPAHLIWSSLQKMSDFKSGSRPSFLHHRGHLDQVPAPLLAAPRKVSLKQYQMGGYILTLIHAQWLSIYNCSVFSWVFHLNKLSLGLIIHTFIPVLCSGRVDEGRQIATLLCKQFYLLLVRPVCNTQWWFNSSSSACMQCHQRLGDMTANVPTGVASASAPVVCWATDVLKRVWLQLSSLFMHLKAWKEWLSQPFWFFITKCSSSQFTKLGRITPPLKSVLKIESGWCAFFYHVLTCSAILWMNLFSSPWWDSST